MVLAALARRDYNADRLVLGDIDDETHVIVLILITQREGPYDTFFDSEKLGESIGSDTTMPSDILLGKNLSLFINASMVLSR